MFPGRQESGFEATEVGVGEGGMCVSVSMWVFSSFSVSNLLLLFIPAPTDILQMAVPASLSISLSVYFHQHL